VYLQICCICLHFGATIGAANLFRLLMQEVAAYIGPRWGVEMGINMGMGLNSIGSDWICCHSYGLRLEGLEITKTVSISWQLQRPDAGAGTVSSVASCWWLAVASCCYISTRLSQLRVQLVEGG